MIIENLNDDPLYYHPRSHELLNRDDWLQIYQNHYDLGEEEQWFGYEAANYPRDEESILAVLIPYDYGFDPLGREAAEILEGMRRMRFT